MITGVVFEPGNSGLLKNNSRFLFIGFYLNASYKIGLQIHP